ncbi:MAG: UDP-galactopyranose mutase [Melioribacteraceae bacterium]|nr:NAD(P)-binding protein [Melioribacteraceae bacterium]WKZ70202.1 MAG: UDP-galactopyranose mutase [Melioribacteraceae bacterium]
MKTEYLIIGSGLTGSVLARSLTDIGKKVIVLERRDHIAGNIYDYYHKSGIRLNKYGPHYFRTNSEKVWKFVNRFSEFYKFEAKLKTFSNSQLFNWPLHEQDFKRIVDDKFVYSFDGEATNFEEASLKMMPSLIYEKFVKGYTKKQWAVDPKQLSKDLAKRFDIRINNDIRLMDHKYQGLPVNGFTALISKMLEGIPVILNCDFLKNRDQFQYSKLIYTGSIDEYYNSKFGKLRYRTQKRIDKYFSEFDSFQNCEQVNYPGEEYEYVRILEWKYMLPQNFREKISGTLITYEIPQNPSSSWENEYPFPSYIDQEIYKKYEKENTDNNIIFCGRLGKYKYYDMDIAISEAFKIFRQIEDDKL